MKITWFLVISILVAVSRALETYIKFDLRCHTAPSNDVCEIINKIPGGMIEDSFNQKIQVIDSANASLDPLNVSDSCRNAVLKSLCTLSFSGCNADGRMVGPEQQDVEDVCQNKLPLPDDSGCDKDAVNNGLQIYLLLLCNELNLTKDLMKCVEYDNNLVPPCPEVSYKGTSMTTIGADITGQQEMINGLELIQNVLKKGCYNDIEEQMCALARPVCSFTDEGMVLSYLSNQKICEEKLECVTAKIPNANVTEMCGALPPGNAETFEYDDTTSGQHVVRPAAVLVVTLGLVLKFIS